MKKEKTPNFAKLGRTILVSWQLLRKSEDEDIIIVPIFKIQHLKE